MKRVRIEVLKVVLFLVILVVLLIVSSYIFIPKNNSSAAGMTQVEAHGYLGEKENTIDVLFVGDSESYSSFSPMLMWEENGFTSYVCGTHAQKIAVSRKFVEEFFEKQKPKIVILETNTIFRKITFEDVAATKAEEILPLFTYHNRWKNLKANDFGGKIQYTWTEDSKGFKNKFITVAASDNEYMAANKSMKEIQEWNLKCLNQIREICEENGAEFILVSTPSVKNWNYPKHNSVAKYAEEYGLKYIDMNLLKDELSIDWSSDSRDKGDHMNYYGAKKVSSYIGKYLSETFNLEDHREDPEYASWNESFERYYEMYESGDPADELLK